MPFNSFEFLFGFLPATLLCVYIATKFASRGSVVTALIVASFLPYAWSSVLYLMMFAALTIINYGCGRAIGVSQRLTASYAINLGVLVYFKYRVFAINIVTTRPSTSALEWKRWCCRLESHSLSFKRLHSSLMSIVHKYAELIPIKYRAEQFMNQDHLNADGAAVFAPPQSRPVFDER
jgi:hypothetical protein